MSGILEDGRVYRIYGNSREFSGYVKGKWKGRGMHGLPEYTSDYSSAVTLHSGKNKVSISLDVNKLFSFSKFKTIFKTTADVLDKFPSLKLQSPAGNWEVDTDIASFVDENYKIEIHAMKNNEMYFLLERLVPERRILFAGVLIKNKFLGIL